jgi:hypothetical protein
LPEIYRSEIPTGIFYAPIETSSGSSTLVVGVAGRRIVVVSAWLVASVITQSKFQTATGPTDLTGPAYDAQYGGIVLPFNPGGWFQTAVGDSLLLNLNPAVAVGGSLSYILV